ncbi:MAG: hypothetical protein JSW06_02885 [Thermoplasmatales archaeon]|nr:MAG: hypothetical protein JSW06_02885 [Thermoplasmatales archaeon]
MYDKETEIKLLSISLIKKTVLDEICTELTPDDFYDQYNKKVYECIKDLYDSDIEVDSISLADKLKQRNIYDNEKFVELISFSEYINTKYAIDLIRKYSVRRNTLDCLIQAQSKIKDLTHDSDEVIETIEEELSNIRVVRKSDYQDFSDLDVKDLSIKGTYFETGFSDIDNYLNGIFKKELFVLAARPSQGKSALAWKLGYNIASKGNQVLFYSLEMDKRLLGTRAISQESKVDIRKIQLGKLDLDDMEKINEVSERIKSTGIKVVQNVYSIDGIVNSIKKFARMKKLDVVIIDYLQLMTSSLKVDRRLQIGDITRRLKILAGQLDINICLLSQLSRKTEERKEPVLSDLKEAGEIEQDADMVWFVHNPDKTQEKINLIFAKNRNGPTGYINMWFIRKCTDFRQVSKDFTGWE